MATKPFTLFSVLVLCFAANTFGFDLTKGLKAYYPFNGNANDVSGNNNNPSFNNATLTTDYYGQPNSAYYFNGINSFMRIPNSPTLNTAGPISICAWIKPMGFYKGTCHGNRIIMKGDADYLTGNYFLTYDDNLHTNGQNCSTSIVDTIHQTLYAPSTGVLPQNDTPYIQMNVWSSLVYTYDGDRAKLYINCKLVLDYPVKNLTFTNSYDLFFGKMNHPLYPYWFNGVLDEVRIYDRPLDESEVQEYSFGCAAKLPCSNWLQTKNTLSGVQIGDLDVSGQQLTVEAVFNRTAPYTGGRLYAGDLVSKHTGPQNANYILRPSSAEITTTNGYFITPAICDIDLNKVYHVAMVYDGKELKFYRNGFLMSKVAATGNLFTNDLTTTIGTISSLVGGSPDESFWGYINEVRIWNVVRTQDEIKTNMNVPLPNPFKKSGLLAYYSFEDLKNKQGDSQWDAKLINNAVVNASNPLCNAFVADSCNIIPSPSSPTVLASFSTPDTVCVNTTVKIVNDSKGASSYKWNFCGNTLNSIPEVKDMGNPGNTLAVPAFMDIVFESGAYYGFVTNSQTTSITRLDFGSSIANTPTATDLGSFNNQIPKNTEGIRIVKSNGKWYGIVGGGNPADNNHPSTIARIDFGMNIANNTPTAVNWGNIGNLGNPMEIYMFEEGGMWYGFTINPVNKTFTRFNFGNDFASPPTATNYGNIGGLVNAAGLHMLKDGNNWRMFIVNSVGNNLTRLDFGASRLNTPVGVNMGNINGVLNDPRDIEIMQYCDGATGFVLNGQTNQMIRLDFGSDFTAAPSTTVLGNIGGFVYPHSISKFITEGNDLYTFIINVNANTITRLKYTGCNNVSLASATEMEPAGLTYKTSGTYSINLMVDEGLTTQTMVCKNIVVKDCSSSAFASFSAPDTVCVNTPVKIKNTTIGASTSIWNFCTADINQTPIGVNLGNPGNALSRPTFIEIVNDNGVYYGFSVNNTGSLVRLSFGNSLLNAPTAINLGSFGGIFPQMGEGLQVIKNEGRWYVIAAGGNPNAGQIPKMVKIDFGPDITNNSPVITNWGNIGALYNPMDMYLYQDGSKWYGFTVNSENNTISRFDFGSSLNNVPTGVNLGNIGALDHPGGVCVINNNGQWRVFVTNAGNNTLSRLDFGNSLLNTPTGINLGNPGGLFKDPRDLNIIQYCDGIVGFVVNGQPVANLLRLNFDNDLTIAPKATVVGNIGNLSFPHSISRVFRQGADLYSFITNVDNNTLTRIKFGGCSDASIPSSTLTDPPDITYNNPGVYNINLTVNEGLPSQSAFCKRVFVVASLPKVSLKDTTLCKDSVVFKSRFTTPSVWNDGSKLDSMIMKNSGYYWVNTDFYGCASRDSFKIALKGPIMVSLGKDSSFCKGDTIKLIYANSPGDVLLWQDGSTATTFNVYTSGKYKLKVTSALGCVGSDSVNFAMKIPPSIKVMNDTTLCIGTKVTLNANLSATDSVRWSPSVNLSDIKVPTPIATVTQDILYVLAAYKDGCVGMDTLSVKTKQAPVLVKSNDTTICRGKSVQLKVTGADQYQWLPLRALSSYNVGNPVATPFDIVKYYITGTGINGCTTRDSIVVDVKAKTTFSLAPFTNSICAGDSTTIAVRGDGNYEWQNDVDNANIHAQAIHVAPASTTQYVVVAKDQFCHTNDTLRADVFVRSLPAISLYKSNDIDCVQGESKLTVLGGTGYSWSPAQFLSDSKIFNPVAKTDSTTTFVVKVTGQNGCISKDSITVHVNKNNGNTYPIINAFTPNGDGLNDYFGVKYWGYVNDFQMNVFDRWGQLLFTSSNPDKLWDGRYKGQLQTAGTYIYTIKAKTLCGPVNKNGTIILIR